MICKLIFNNQMKNVLHVINRIDEIEYYKDKKK